MQCNQYPAVFLCHGGGPLPVLGDPMHADLVRDWKRVTKNITSKHGSPKAIVVVSAHFETKEAAVGGALRPEMWHDYSGFGPESKTLQCPAPGNPELAERIIKSLKSHSVSCSLDATRPFDHGVFAPLMLMFPEAKIPVIPVSVLESQDATRHIDMGKALAFLRKEGVLIIGSGSSMHNFSLLFSKDKSKKWGTLFNEALTRVLCDRTISPMDRLEAMKGVATFPGIDESHPRGEMEHLMPLLTVVGATLGACASEFSDVEMMGCNMRQYMFE